MLRKLLLICSAHKKRGERIQYFNISPYNYEPLKKLMKEGMIFTYMDQKIPVISEGWKKVDGVWVKEMITSEGDVITLDFVYKLYD